MATQIQLRRGTTSEHAAFTGAVGEVTIDTDKDTVVVHDGSVVGGRALLREDLGNLPAGTIDNTDISANAEIAVSKLADGTARQLLQTDAAGTGVEWASNIDIPGTLDVTSAATFDSTIGASAGTASLPSIIFTGAGSTTGIYSPGANQVAISTNGSGRLFIDASGNVGIGGAATANGRLKINVGSGLNANIVFSEDNTDRYLLGQVTGNNAFRVYDLVAATERLRITSAGLVGVGTSSPSARLDVEAPNFAGGPAIGARYNTSNVRLGFNVANSNGFTYIGSNTNNKLSSDTATYDLTGQPASQLRLDGGQLIFNNAPIGTAGNDITFTNRLTITSAGLVGVGTTSPGYKLTVQSDSTNTVFSQPFYNYGLVVRNDDTTNNNYAALAFATRNTTAADTSIAAIAALCTDHTSSSVDGELGFFTTGANTISERARIDSSGRLGIGTSSPAAKLHLGDGNIYLERTQNGSAASPLEEAIITYGVSNTARGGLYAINQYVNSLGTALAFKVTSTAGVTSSALTIGTSGAVGIGTTGPQATLHAHESGSTTARIRITNSTTTDATGRGLLLSQQGTSAYITNNESGDLVVTNNGSEAFRVDSSRRLLVGTSSSTGVNASVQIRRDANNLHLELFEANSNVGEGPAIYLSRSRGTEASPTEVADGDTLGYLVFRGYDGASWQNAAWIKAEADGTWTDGGDTTDNPARLVFSTTRDGAASPTEAVRINEKGALKVTTTGSYNSATNKTHELRNDLNDWGVYIHNVNATPRGLLLSFPGASPNGTGNEFLYCDDSSALRASIRSNGGLVNFQANNVNLSDRNAKKDITPAADTWNCVKEWEIVNYRYKDQLDDTDLNLGVIAQQVAESCPEVITVFQEATEDEPEKLGVKEQQMYWMAIKALQEAQVRIEQLEAKVAALEAA